MPIQVGAKLPEVVSTLVQQQINNHWVEIHQPTNLVTYPNHWLPSILADEGTTVGAAVQQGAVRARLVTLNSHDKIA